MPTPTSDERVEQLYARLLQIESAPEREAFLAAEQAESPEIVEQVRELYRYGQSAQRVFGVLDEQSRGLHATADSNPMGRTGFANPAVHGSLAKIRSGATIGPYKLLEPIGEGGMGVVYLAQQSSPVRRKVALKVIKPGMDSHQVVARFEAERQALAMMEHPNIAKVLDAGTTESGLPYFVMELVRGIPMTEYCDRARMPTRQRLELFCDACSAIQHAHNKGVIHRDIKPSNVLVTEQDGKPLVKVIDFGVAKALTDNLTDKTLFTGMFQMIGTPLYMSPEQASLSNMDVDTRSDVYSLGVMLYELVSGTLPIDRETAKGLSFEQLRQRICDTEPPRPSRRLSTLKDERQTIAERRGVEAKQIHRLVSSELDWIVMKAIEKDRTRRYQSARELGEDVHRFHDGYAVEACPPTIFYQLQKIFQRNRAAFSVIIIVILLLSLGAVLISREALRANRAEEVAIDRLEAFENEQKRTVAALRKAEVAEREQRILRLAAEQNERRANWNLYVARLSPIREAFEDGDYALLRRRLKDSEPSAGEPDYRGWEWSYLEAQAEGASALIRGRNGPAAGPIAWSNETRTLATYSDSRSVVEFWSLEPIQAVRSIPIDQNPSVMQFDRSGSRLAIGSQSGVVLILDANSGMIVFDQDVLQSRRHQKVMALSWSHDSEMLGVGDWHGKIGVLAIETGETRILRDPENLHFCFSLDWHPERPLLAAGMRSGLRRVYDTINGSTLDLPQSTMGVGYGVRWSPSGDLLATGENGVVQICNREGQVVQKIGIQDGDVRDTRWVDEDRLVVATSDGVICVVSRSRDGIIARHAVHNAGVTSLAIDRQKSRSISSSSPSDVRVTPLVRPVSYISLASNIEYTQQFLDYRIEPEDKLEHGFIALRWKPSGDKIAALGVAKIPGVNMHTSTLTVWDTTSRKSFFSKEITFSKSMEWCEDQACLLFGENDALVSRNPRTGAIIDKRSVLHTDEPYAHWNGVNSFVFRPDHRLLRTDSLAEVADFRKNEVGLRHCAWHPDGKQFVFGGHGGTRYATISGKLVSLTYQDTSASRCSDWHPSGKLFLVGTDSGKILFFLPGESKPFLVQQAHRGSVSGIHFSPDGKRFAATGDASLGIWDVATGSELLRLRTEDNSHLSDVRWSPDGSKLAATGRNEVFVWDCTVPMDRSTYEWLHTGPVARRLSEEVDLAE